MANGPTTNLDTISTAQSQKEVTANETDDAESPSSFGGRHATACSGLTWGYYGGTYVTTGTVTQFANGTLTLTASTTNYVQFNPSGATVSSNTSAFTTGQVPLYKVVTGASTVTSWEDCRGIVWATF